MSTQRMPTETDREDRPRSHEVSGHRHEERVERQIIVTGGRDRGTGAVIAGVLAILAVLVILAVVLLGNAANDLGDVVPDQVDIDVQDGNDAPAAPDAGAEGEVDTTN